MKIMGGRVGWLRPATDGGLNNSLLRNCAAVPRSIALSLVRTVVRVAAGRQRLTTAGGVRRVAPVGLVLAVSLLAACQTMRAPAPGTPPTLESWEARRTELQARQHFNLKGRVAVAAGEEGFNASLRWTQEGNRSEVSLDGPLGVGGVQISADGATLRVVNSRGEQLDDASARTELAARLGFEPPLTSLRYWVLGVSDPSLPSQETLDPQRRLARLEQSGWEIEYGGYIPASAASEWLPQRLTLQREGVRVRLLVDAWGS